MDSEAEPNLPEHAQPVPAADREPIGYLTSTDLRTGGVLKSDPEDFVVEEIPAYLPSGTGEHLYLWIEKRDISADFLLDRISRALGISRGDIGMAGIKDRRAVTRQWISVPARCREAVANLAIEGVTVLETALHGNKLRTGHLKGNQFQIRLRGIDPSTSLSAALQIAAELRRLGIPNLYGDQRFGIDDQTLQLGLSLLRGEKSPRSIPFAKRKFLLRLALSSVQSALFNAVLSERLKAGTLSQVQAGDVLQVTASGGCFLAEDPIVEQVRCDAGETVITGPMFGPKMKSPAGDVLDAERRILTSWNLEPTAFERFGDLTSGTRRPLVVRADDLAADVEGDSLILKFRLPAGSYATSVIREFQKNTNHADSWRKLELWNP
jgi:tRNA pseudouridine13 synthase